MAERDSSYDITRDSYNTDDMDGGGEEKPSMQYMNELITNLQLQIDNLAAKNMFVRGKTTITPSAANVPTSKVVSFGKTFPGVPTVIPAANTTVPGSVVTEVSVTNITATEFTLWVTRTNTTDTNILWIAMWD